MTCQAMCQGVVNGRCGSGEHRSRAGHRTGGPGYTSSMAGPARFHRVHRGTRTVFLSVLLLLALTLALGVGWRAHEATRSHRERVETVVRDYASLAAGEMLRRSVSLLIQSYCFPLQHAVQRAVENGGPIPRPDDLASQDREDLEKAFSVGRFVFRFRLGDPGSVEIAGDPPSPEEHRWLLEFLSRNAPKFPKANLPFLMLYGPPRQAPLMAIYWVDGKPDETGLLQQGAVATGVALDRGELHRVFADALESATLLPGPATGAEVDNREVRVTVRDWTGTEVFRSHASPIEDAVQVERGDDALARGTLVGWTVRVEIAREAAPRLIIGGLPRSRLPSLLALLALAVGLIVAALWLLARERELARLRSDFVSRVSHELRTPLTQIRMFAETLLLDRVRSPDERRRSMEIIDGEARRLSHLVENVLQLSRSERGALHVTPERCDLSALTARLAAELQPLLVKGRLTANVEPDLYAQVDPDAIRQIVLNLLDNAIKYGAPDDDAMPEIRLALERRSDRVLLSLEDDGPGVPRRERERIWERFHRIERDSEATGTGIGLAVVRELVLAQGGRVWVESSERGGARFVVELPREPMTDEGTSRKEAPWAASW